MKPEHEKAPRWLWKIALFVLILGIVVLLASQTSSSKSSGEGGTIANAISGFVGLFKTKPTVWSYNLNGGEWSGWIVTPSGSDYIIDVEIPVQVCYWDDPGCVKPFTAYPASYKKPIWLPRGLNRQSFKLLSPVDTTATVTIQER